MHLWPWEYLFKSFNSLNFPDLYWSLLYASLLWFAASIVIYNVRTRQLRRHAIYVQMYEWLMWTGVITSTMILVYWVFRFDMIIVIGTLVGGLAMLVWIRFFKFPPDFRAYERQLAKQRYFTRDRFAHPESTIRSKSSRRRRRRR